MLSRYSEFEESAGAMKINNILDSLNDKEWHQLDALTAETKIEKEQVLKIVNFFHDYGFIEISASGNHIKIDKDYVNL